jgi:dCTP deaminase
MMPAGSEHFFFNKTEDEEAVVVGFYAGAKDVADTGYQFRGHVTDADLANGVALSVDLSGENAKGFVGYRAKRHTGVVDIDRRGGYVVDEFWEAISARPDGSLILDPGEFYILASKEAVQVPPDYAAEMVPFDPLVGEFRVHYAGFFDPGFGHSAAGGAGSRAVLEVRSHEVPFILEHGQTVGRLVYELMTERPTRLYGTDMASNYQAQGLKLSKHFRTGPGSAPLKRRCTASGTRGHHTRKCLLSFRPCA